MRQRKGFQREGREETRSRKKSAAKSPSADANLPDKINLAEVLNTPHEKMYACFLLRVTSRPSRSQRCDRPAPKATYPSSSFTARRFFILLVGVILSMINTPSR